jgi:hypothetical protein
LKASHAGHFIYFFRQTVSKSVNLFVLVFFFKVRLLVELYLCGVCDDAQLLVRCLRRSYRGTAPPRKDGGGEELDIFFLKRGNMSRLSARIWLF